jgi:hypothetical protein
MNELGNALLVGLDNLLFRPGLPDVMVARRGLGACGENVELQKDNELEGSSLGDIHAGESVIEYVAKRLEAMGARMADGGRDGGLVPREARRRSRARAEKTGCLRGRRCGAVLVRGHGGRGEEVEAWYRGRAWANNAGGCWYAFVCGARVLDLSTLRFSPGPKPMSSIATPLLDTIEADEPTPPAQRTTTAAPARDHVVLTPGGGAGAPRALDRLASDPSDAEAGARPSLRRDRRTHPPSCVL